MKGGTYEKDTVGITNSIHVCLEWECLIRDIHLDKSNGVRRQHRNPIGQTSTDKDTHILGNADRWTLDRIRSSIRWSNNLCWNTSTGKRSHGVLHDGLGARWYAVCIPNPSSGLHALLRCMQTRV